MEITKYLDNSNIVKSYQILDFKTFETGFYFKISVELINTDKIFIKEYIDESERNYSYHWQDDKNNLIMRWDNAPYHKNIETFPHHLHNKNGIFENFDITILDILKTIEKSILSD